VPVAERRETACWLQAPGAAGPPAEQAARLASGERAG